MQTAVFWDCTYFGKRNKSYGKLFISIISFGLFLVAAQSVVSSYLTRKVFKNIINLLVAQLIVVEGHRNLNTLCTSTTLLYVSGLSVPGVVGVRRIDGCSDLSNCCATVRAGGRSALPRFPAQLRQGADAWKKLAQLPMGTNFISPYTIFFYWLIYSQTQVSFYTYLLRFELNSSISCSPYRHNRQVR